MQCVCMYVFVWKCVFSFLREGQRKDRYPGAERQTVSSTKPHQEGAKGGDSSQQLIKNKTKQKPKTLSANRS